MATQLPDDVRLLRTLTGHRALIGRIGWSPDGRLLATPSMDGTVPIWDAASGDCVRVIRGRHADVFAAAFDPDGRTLATGGVGGTELWDVESGKWRTTLDSGVCHAVAFSPRNSILVTANDVSEVMLWEPSTGAVLHRLAGRGAIDVAFDAEGSMLATASSAGTIILWEIPNWGQVRTLDGHAEPVHAVAFHPGGKILASASYGRTIRLWDVATGNTVSILEGHTGPLQSLSRFPGTVGCSPRRVRMAPSDSGRPKADGAGQSCLSSNFGCPVSRSTHICRSWRRSRRTLNPSL